MDHQVEMHQALVEEVVRRQLAWEEVEAPSSLALEEVEVLHLWVEEVEAEHRLPESAALAIGFLARRLRENQYPCLTMGEVAPWCQTG